MIVLIKKSNEVVFTGIGPICSLGFGKDPVWKKLLSAETNIVKDTFKSRGEEIHSYSLHKLPSYDLSSFNIDPAAIDSIEEWKSGDKVKDIDLFLIAIKLALEDSKLAYSFESNDIGLVLAAESPGHGEFFIKFIEHSLKCSSLNNISNPPSSFYADFYNNFKRTGYDLQSFMTTFHIAKSFNFHGFSVILNNACASGLYAIDYASALIETGRCDVVVVAAVDSPNIFKSLWFSELGISPHDDIIRPFDDCGQGFILGEGGAALVLESKEHALARGASIYGEYLGGGFNIEGWKVSLPRVNEEFYVEAIRDSIANSRINASEIDLVVPHGVGTRIYDNYEARSLNQVFSKFKKNFLATALKPYFGHVLGGSTILETAVLLLMLQHQVVLPTLNVSMGNSTGIKSKICLKRVDNMKLKYVLKSCTAFAGFNSSIVIKSYKN